MRFMNIKKYASNFNALRAFLAVGLLVAGADTFAAVPPEVTKAITDGFTDANTVAFAILVGLAVLYGITLAKRLLR